MKLTTNYIVYLNADNKVQCAKCRLTGQFVKRAVAQLEYDFEYVYIFKGFFAFMFFMFVFIPLLVAHKRMERIINQIKVLNDEKESICKIDGFRRLRILNCKIQDLEGKLK